MIKYNKPALEGYLRGCVDITELVQKAIPYFEDLKIVAAHIDLRQCNKDIVLLGVVRPELSESEVHYFYRMIDSSPDPNDFSPKSVISSIKRAFWPTNLFDELTGDRIRQILKGKVIDKVTNVNYIVERNVEIFFDGTLRNKIHYWYSDGTKPSDTPDGMFFLHGRFDQTPRSGYFKSPSNPTTLYTSITERILYDEVVAHDKKNRQ